MPRSLPLRRLTMLLAGLSLALAGCGSRTSDAEGTQAANVRADGTAELGEGKARLRVVAANITSGNLQSYDPGEGARILQGLTPDVVLIQEFNYGANDEAAIRGFVDTTFGPQFQYTRESGAQIPNGVISRYPIVASGVWDDPEVQNRELVWAHIDVPGPVDLWAVSAHLLTSNSGDRQAEAAVIVARLRETVPAGDYVVVGGDFNTGSRSEAAIRTFAQELVTAGPYPADSSGNSNTSASRSKPLDWVLADPDLDAHRLPVLLGGQTFPAGLVFDSRRFRPIEAVPPIRTGDSAARNMQHMAVVRDFALPGASIEADAGAPEADAARD